VWGITLELRETWSAAAMPTERHRQDLSRFANRVLVRSRTATGVAVYRHADGSLGFVARQGDVAVTRTLRHTVSYSLRCRTCGVTVATCTTREGARVRTPCACAPEVERRDAADSSARAFEKPCVDLDAFAASVHAEVTRDEPFVLFGMVRGFVRAWWPLMGSRPDPQLWAKFFVTRG
jgi:hypothetical protein